MTRFFLCLFLVMLFFPINISAKDNSASSIVIDNATGRVLYKNNINEKRLIASTTKIMTAILTIENANLDDTIKVGNEILDMYGTNIYIEVGEKITIKNLLYGLILRSGNDAAKTLSINIGGTEKKFVEMMNKKAKELGMNNTTFENPHGLDDYTKNYSTAYDMALLSQYASRNKQYMKISKTKKYSAKTKNKAYLWYNRNKLLNMYEYCTGGKNGYTPDAGKTLVTTAEKDGLSLSIVSLNDSDTYDTHKSLYENIYSKYKNYTIINKETFKLENSKYKNKVHLKNSFVYPLTKKERENIKTKVILFNESEIKEIIGYVQIKLNNETIGRVNIYKNEEKKEDEVSIFKKGTNYLVEILKKLKLGLQNSLNPGSVVPNPLDIYSFVFPTL